MKDELIIEAMAKLDGYTAIHAKEYPLGLGTRPDRNCRMLPNYLNSHDAVQRVVDGLGVLSGDRYWLFLMDVVIGRRDNIIPINLLKATPRQKCEAVLRAYDKWGD